MGYIGSRGTHDALAFGFYTNKTISCVLLDQPTYASGPFAVLAALVSLSPMLFLPCRGLYTARTWEPFGLA
jgi:hypothetical protein